MSAAASAARAPGPPPGVSEAAICDIGLVRASNQDALVRRPEAGVWAVADGMGGHQGGEWASQVVADRIGAARLDGDLHARTAALETAIARANHDIHREAQARGTRMGSTVVALLLGADGHVALWAGDSRAYRLRAGTLTQLTRDHTQVQERVDRGQMSPEEATGHPLSHVLTRAVGADAAVELGRAEGGLQAGDVFLLCSDGLHGVARPEEIARALGGGDPAAACAELLELCRSRGAPDNVSIIVVAC